MKSQRAWVTYTVIRILSFAVPFAVVMLALPTAQFNWIIAAAVGATISLCVSFIFLRSARARMSGDLAELRTRKDRRTDEDRAEDAVLDEAAPEASEQASGDDATAARTDGSAGRADDADAEAASSAADAADAVTAGADERAAGDDAKPATGPASRG